jgi:hypothetical protein
MRLATVAGGGPPAPPGGWVPYVHGATQGRPSRGRPENVLARIREEREDAEVGGGQVPAGAPDAVPGTARSGFPGRPARLYAYGESDPRLRPVTGKPPRTATVAERVLEALAALGGEASPSEIVAEFGREGHPAEVVQVGSALAGLARRSPPAVTAEGAGRSRRWRLAGDGKTEEESAPPAAGTPGPESAAVPPDGPAERGPVPVPEVKRHRKCGYVKDSPGCRMTCGGAA